MYLIAAVLLSIGRIGRSEMKRYEPLVDFDNQFMGMDDDPNGQWVPASVAQALYDALVEMVSAINYPNPDAPNRVEVAERSALDAISQADGESE